MKKLLSFAIAASITLAAAADSITAEASIEQIPEQTNTDNKVFDLLGRQCNKSLLSLPRGIYIVNGRKIIR